MPFVTDTIPVVSNRPSGVAHKRPDEARLLVTTTAIVEKLVFVWFIGASLMPQEPLRRVGREKAEFSGFAGA